MSSYEGELRLCDFKNANLCSFITEQTLIWCLQIPGYVPRASASAPFPASFCARASPELSVGGHPAGPAANCRLRIAISTQSQYRAFASLAEANTASC